MNDLFPEKKTLIFKRGDEVGVFLRPRSVSQHGRNGLIFRTLPASMKTNCYGCSDAKKKSFSKITMEVELIKDTEGHM